MIGSTLQLIVLYVVERQFVFLTILDKHNTMLPSCIRQDGGNFAYKSAVSMLRSANPDHLESSNLDREALKTVIFRR